MTATIGLVTKEILPLYIIIVFFSYEERALVPSPKVSFHTRASLLVIYS